MNVNNRADAYAVAAAAQTDARALQAAADGQGYVPELAQAWADAETAAFEAAFAGWARWPESATLGPA